MKVTFASSLCGNLVRRGGLEIQAEQTAKALTELGVEVEFFGPLSRSIGDVVHCFGSHHYYGDLRSYCERQGVPFLCSTILYYSGGPWELFRARAGARFGPDANKYKALKRLLRKADLLLPNSQAEADQLEYVLWQDASRIRVVPNGVDARFAHGDAEAFRSHFQIREPFILNVASLDRRKNQHRLIEACAGIPMSLVIIGNRGFDSAYAEECRRLAGPKVKFLDPIQHDDPLLAGAFAAADVFALPSILETPGLVSLEAGVAGARIVTTPVGGAREYFGDFATYPDPTSVQDIATSITLALKRPHEPEAQREFLLRRFSWSEIGAQTLDAYASLQSCR